MTVHHEFSRADAFRAFGFARSPFAALEDPETAWPRASVLREVRDALEGGAAVVAITGERGRGKTSLTGPLRALLGEAFTVGALPSDGAGDGARRVLAAFVPEGAALARFEARRALRDLLEGRRREDRPCVLIVDDAHRPAEAIAPVLERFSEDDADAALRAVLIAPRAELRRSPLKALPRIEIEVGPLSPEEASDYLRHRLRAAGGPGDLFDEAAARALGSAAGGAPPALDLLGAACLETAAARGMRRIDVDLVRAVTGAMRGPSPDAAAGEAPPAAAPGAEPAGHPWMPAGVDEFRFLASRKAAPAAPPAPADEGGGAPSGVGPAAATSPPDRATPAADGPRGPTDRPGPVRGTGLEGARAAEGRADHGEGRVGGGAVRARPEVHAAPGRLLLRGAVEPAAPRDASRRWVAASAAGAMVVGLAIGAGLGSALVPLGFATATGWSRAGGDASTGGADATPPPPAAAVLAAAEREPGDGVIAPSALPAASAEREAEARSLYERAVDLAASDPAAAVVAYARAALRGHARSARYLGQIYEIGDGVEPSPALARAWYDFAEGGAARGGPSEEAPGLARPSGAPRPAFSARMPDGAVEMVWSGAPDGAGYRVEFARDPLAEPVGSFGTAISAALATVPRDVAFWRVALAGGGAAEGGWTRIGSPAAP